MIHHARVRAWGACVRACVRGYVCVCACVRACDLAVARGHQHALVSAFAYACAQANHQKDLRFKLELSRQRKLYIFTALGNTSVFY